jgi:hypothetical protein
MALQCRSGWKLCFVYAMLRRSFSDMRTVSMIAICLLGYSFETKTNQPSENALLKAGHPGAFITRSSISCRQPGQVRLTFHNNYRFSVVLNLIGSDKGDTALAYEVVTKDDGIHQMVEQIAREVSTTQQLDQGKQLSFCIPNEHLSASRYVRIPFKIVGEMDTAHLAAPEHLALFYGEGK